MFMIKEIIFLLCFILMMPVAFSQNPGQNQQSYISDPEKEETIVVDEWGECRKITNKGEKKYFIPTNSAEEWKLFREAVEKNSFAKVTASDCDPEIMCYSKCKVSSKFYTANALINLSAAAGNAECARFGTDWEWAYYKCLQADSGPGDIGWEATVNHGANCLDGRIHYTCIAEGTMGCKDYKRWFSAARDENDYYVTWEYLSTPTLSCNMWRPGECIGCTSRIGGRSWSYWDTGGTYCPPTLCTNTTECGQSAQGSCWRDCHPGCGMAPLLCCKKDPNAPPPSN